MMPFSAYAPILVNIAIFLGGLIVAFIGNYFTTIKDLAYIKGQLTEILKCHDEVTILVEKHGKLESSFAKTSKDLDKVFLRIKGIEARLVNATNQGGLL